MITILISFISQKIFVDTLGVEYLGLNGLLTNIISMLSVAELGLSTAVVYHLYKPLREKDSRTISSIMHFYKSSYRLIALAVFLLGAILFPFIPSIIGESTIQINILIVYMLFIVNVTVSYLVSYKRSILYADQKNYVVNAVHLLALIILNIIQIWILLTTQNYYLYLMLKIATTISENILISKIVDRNYHLDSKASPLDIETKKDIFMKIKGLLYHKAGEFLVLGSTNIIISIFLGLKIVGLYSNYLLIQVAISTLFDQMQAAITASIGHLLLGDGKKEHFAVFKKLHFATHTLAIIFVSVFLVASSSFITLWLGREYVFTLAVLIALSFNIYLFLVRSAFGNFKNAAGIFYEDRYVALIESMINIVASIVLIQFIGLAGAFIGTALSSLALHCYSYPKFVYKGLLGREYSEYAVLVSKNLAIATVVITAAYFVSKLIRIDSPLLQLMSDSVVAVLVPSILLWVMYRKSSEYIYFKLLLVKIVKKMNGRLCRKR
jgi:O-antigen/teichoic acid export membrane protein